MKRFTTISSLPNVMTLGEYEQPVKHYDKSIVDKSCFTTLGDQLAKIQPMTASEIEQHYDFIDGKDDGRKAPMRKGADISEISVAARNANEKLKKQIKEASERTKTELQQKALVESIKESSETK